jgi:hypothetical protein
MTTTDHAGEGAPAAPAAAAAPDWRAGIRSEEGREFARSSSDVDHLVNRALDLRKQVAAAIFKPGRDARPEQWAAYRRAMEIPETAEGYRFPAPPPGEALSAEVQARRLVWAQRFHDHNVPGPAAEALIRSLGEDAARAMQQQADDDRAYAARSVTALRQAWGGEFDRNTEHALRAFSAMAAQAGVDEAALRGIETKGGLYLMDHPDLLRIFAAVGREMTTAGIGGGNSDSDALGDRIAALQHRIAAAQASGDAERADELYRKKLELIGTRDGATRIT